jgi:hypothetical protein
LLVAFLDSQLDLLEEKLAEEEIGYPKAHRGSVKWVSLLVTKGGRVVALIQLHRFLVPIEGWDPSAGALSCIVADLAY